jgi:FkbM family methyltransferase
VWPILWPVRFYLTKSPFRFGRSLAERIVFLLLPPAPISFTARLPLGHKVRLQYREAIGYLTLLYGSFEDAEMQSLASRARPHSTAFDVGANVGIHTIALANAVGPAGSVIAFEPADENVERLRQNLELNDVRNTEIVPMAAAANDEGVLLNLSDDSAFHSTTDVSAGHVVNETTRVASTSLDDAWIRVGRPSVSVVKIDVEGAELDVLRGAAQVLSTCRPATLIEISDHAQLLEIKTLLATYGYRLEQPLGFTRWNYLFSPDRPDE